MWERRSFLQPLLVLTLAQWRQSANDRWPRRVWAGSLCHWTLPLTLHLLSPKHWARVPAETRRHRDPSCRHWAASVLPICLYKVQSGAWHRSRLAARPSPGSMYVQDGQEESSSTARGWWLLLFNVRGDSCCDSEESDMVLSLITVALSKHTEEPLQPSVDSDHLHRSGPLGSLEMAFVLRRRCLSCAFGIVQREKKNFPHSAGC